MTSRLDIMNFLREHADEIAASNHKIDDDILRIICNYPFRFNSKQN
ncbi:MAG: hypothetical protein ACTSW1_13130 [Candidatus Hodarchaeales archaeon]